MKRKLLLALRNPLIVIPPFVIILGLGWQQYTYAGRDLSLPVPKLNLLPNSDFTQFAPDGVPTGWQLTKAGSTDYTVTHGQGYVDGNTFQIAVSNYQAGDIALTSPKVAIQAGKTYLFKGYYNASVPFTVAARYYNADGTSTTQLVRTYPVDTDTWSTTSDAFQPAPDVVAVQFIYRLYANGRLQLNGLYVEPQADVYIPPQQSGPNNIPNSTLAPASFDIPQNWSTYHTGNNTAVFSYQPDPAGAYVQAQMRNYKDGQAKWQYVPQPVQPNQYYQVSLDYQSDVPVSLTAEYVLSNGQRQDQTITQLTPAEDWTTATYQFEVLPGATTMFISAPLQRAGTITSRNYTLTNITKSGGAQWQQPLVSITFDDGWQLSYSNAASLLKNYGYKATYYINPSAIETPDFMTADELTALRKNGNEIAAHGYEHDDMTAINKQALDYQLHEGRDYLRDAGFQVTDFATPYGRSDAEVQWYARQYFTTLRGTDTGVNTLQNLDPYNLKVLYVTIDTNPAAITAALQLAKAYHGWLILVYHQISDPTLDYNMPHVESSGIPTSNFKRQMSLVHDSGIKVLPVAAAYQTVQHQ